MVINKKTKHFDCRPALNPSRILQGEISGRFWKILEDFGRKILPKSCKMLINLDLGRLRALKISSNRLRDLRDRLRDLRDLRDLQTTSRGSKCDQRISNFQQKKFGVDGRIGSTAPDQIKKSMRLELFPQPIDNFECALFATPTMPAARTLQ